MEHSIFYSTRLNMIEQAKRLTELIPNYEDDSRMTESVTEAVKDIGRNARRDELNIEETAHGVVCHYSRLYYAWKNANKIWNRRGDKLQCTMDAFFEAANNYQNACIEQLLLVSRGLLVSFNSMSSREPLAEEAKAALDTIRSINEDTELDERAKARRIAAYVSIGTQPTKDDAGTMFSSLDAALKAFSDANILKDPVGQDDKKRRKNKHCKK